MNYWTSFIFVAVISYLLGSLNFALISSKLFLKMDIRDYGSGNAGSTNALRVMGKKYALFVALGDILKGLVAVIIGYYIMDTFSAGDYGKLAAGTFAVLGHMFPVYFGFRGGKGIITTAAFAAMIDWRICLIAITLFLIIVFFTRMVSLGSVIAILTFPPLSGYFHDWRMDFLFISVFLAAIVIFKHRGNIKRIINGTEGKISFKK